MHQGFAVVSRIFTTLTFENMYNCASLFEYAYQINFLEFTKNDTVESTAVTRVENVNTKTFVEQERALSL